MKALTLEQKKQHYYSIIRDLGYQIQVGQGLVYPSDTVLEMIKRDKLKLKKELELFRQELPELYNTSSAAKFYKHYAEEVGFKD